ncbi:hypothetical protein PN836_019535 [Ningiella sp. W23]|uniref:glycosyltransferase family protein n=1 Tax=Ningiella sp. W23 TaxID=3023715 RepID=UPI003756A32C
MPGSQKMAKYCIASPHKDDTWYDYRLYLSLKQELSGLGHIHQAGAKNRIYFLGAPLKFHYPKVGEFDPSANNIALIYCHFQKIENISQFDHVFVPSESVKKKFERKAFLDTLTLKKEKAFKTKRPIGIVRPFSSLEPNDDKLYKLECDIAFMGVPRLRPIVESAVKIVQKHDLSFKIIGADWLAYPGNPDAINYCATDRIPYRHMPAFANSAKIHLVDHHASMKEYGAVSHKYIDLIKGGAFVISDDNPDAREYYRGEVFGNDDELEALILRYLSDHQARSAKVLEQQAICKNQTSADAAYQLAKTFI